MKRHRSPFKGRVLRNIRRQIEQEKQEMSAVFKEIYDGTREFKWKKVVNVEKFFCFPKQVLQMGLSKSALAIYPVLCSQADFKEQKWYQLSQEHISKLAGVSVNAVVTASRELVDVGLLERQKKTKGVRHYYVYRPVFIRQGDMKEYEGTFFIFHTCIIESKVWSKLQPRAKALYLALRSVARFDADIYAEIEGVEEMTRFDIYNVDGQYRNRKWDLCHSTLAELCRIVNIQPRGIETSVQQLEQVRLVDKLEHGFFRVWLKPRISSRKVTRRKRPKPEPEFAESGESTTVVRDGKIFSVSADGVLDVAEEYDKDEP